MAQIAANLQRIKTVNAVMQLHLAFLQGFIQPDQLQKYIDVANEFGAVLKINWQPTHYDYKFESRRRR